MDDEDHKWCASRVECLLRTNQWVAVWPECAKELECPNCGNLSEPIIINQEQ